MSMDAQTSPLLKVTGITKSFPGVKALKGVHLTVTNGEVLGLMGENGAGKSTLIKVLGGAHKPDSGEILLGGEKVQFQNPPDSMRAGISVIYQELNLIPYLSITDNLFLGKEKVNGMVIDKAYQTKRTEHWLGRLGLPLSPNTLIKDLSISQQQLVEIAKALEQDARVLIMDEPTAALTDSETKKLHEITRELKSDGLAIIYVSHRLDEIFSITDTLVIFRDGEYIDEGPTAKFTRNEIIEKLVGRDLDSEFPPSTTTPGEVIFEVNQVFNPPKVESFSLNLRKGEILGLTGMVGAGRTEAARIIFGADPGTIEDMTLHGKAVHFRSPAEAIRHGVVLLPEDRKKHGLVLGHGCGENFLLPNLDRLAPSGFVNEAESRDLFQTWVEKLQIKCHGWGQSAKTLSGGNQQKIVLSKWLVRNCEVIIFDEPTRGIDVGAKFEFYQWMRKLCADGKAIIMISSDMQEVMGMSDRIFTMADGRITAELINDDQLTAEEVLKHSIGKSSHAQSQSTSSLHE